MNGERNTLLVHLNETLVGRLRLLDGGFDATEFRLERSYLDMPSRPVLGQTFVDDPSPRKSRVRVPAFFSNLLPEGPLRELLARHAGVHPAREFFLLRELGGDLPGAAIVTPAGSIEGPSLEVESELPRPGPPMDPLRFSLAGLQLKFSADRDADKWRLPFAGKGGKWLLKMPDAKLAGVPRNEWAMMQWARLAGIAVPDVELVRLADVAGLPPEIKTSEPDALLVRRFDRQEGTRVHTEDFLQVLDRHADGFDVKYSAGSYDQLARLLVALGGLPDLEEYIRRLVFNIIIGNSDAHLKNWSLWYPDSINARLAPAYDLVSTVQYVDDPTVALNLSGTKRYAELDAGRFVALVKELVTVPGVDDLGLTQSIMLRWTKDAADRAMAAWPQVREATQPGQSFVDRLEAHWKNLPLLRLS